MGKTDQTEANETKAAAKLRIETEAETARGAQNPDPDGIRLFAKRANLQAQMDRLTRERRWISLRETVNWLAAFNRQGFRGTIDDKAALSYVADLRDALCDGAFSRAIGGKPLPRVLILAADQPAARFNAEDIDAVKPKPKDNRKRQTGMYDDPEMLRALIERLWVPRDLLLSLFAKMHWQAKPILDDPQVIGPTRKRGRPNKSGKYLLVVEYLGKIFPEGPVPAHAPRQPLLRDAIEAIPELKKALHGDTLKKAIEEHNEKFLQKQRA